MVGGVAGETSHPLSIHMRYDDDLLVERPARRVQITSSGIEALSKKAPQERFLLWEHSYASTLQNFVYNITPDRFPERPIFGTERFNAQLIDGKRVPRVVHLPSAGPRRFIDAVPFRDGYKMERIAFDEWPALRLNRLQMTEVEVLILAWGWDDEPLLEFAAAARPITNDLLSEIGQAEFDAWKKINKRKQRDQGP
ncbi:MAG: hypothetical protein M3N53_13630 [Actinomycetota bacterium]|nr:hypothetical protein [Actinomycetota bacterium]